MFPQVVIISRGTAVYLKSPSTKNVVSLQLKTSSMYSYRFPRMILYSSHGHTYFGKATHAYPSETQSPNTVRSQADVCASLIYEAVAAFFQHTLPSHFLMLVFSSHAHLSGPKYSRIEAACNVSFNYTLNLSHQKLSSSSNAFEWSASSNRSPKKQNRTVHNSVCNKFQNPRSTTF